MICEHGRMADTCEDCAFIRAQQRGLPLGGPQPAKRPEADDTRQVATADMTVVTETDGDGGTTGVRVAKGDPIPPEVAGRVPKRQQAKASTGRSVA